MSVNTDCSVAPAPVHGVVEFDPAAFRLEFPQFTNPPTTDLQLQFYFTLATLILNNSCGSIVSDGNQRELLLNLLVAHIATLMLRAAKGVPIVGPITGASEGSVSVQSAWAASVSQSEAYFIQTQFGFTFWQLTLQYRTMHYIAPCYPYGPAGAFPGRRGY